MARIKGNGIKVNFQNVMHIKYNTHNVCAQHNCDHCTQTLENYYTNYMLHDFHTTIAKCD